ncbi:uncharacterized protein LOC141660299 [Apium graveolens]|uniref:uncharacterized protein LOC141660299 n=1 Tax=Apium graveolens TaxID=4045 RepID=UPI003D7A74CD
MNMPSLFVGWIKECISSTWFSVKINGSLNGFSMGRKVFDKCKDIKLNHLFFADDVLFFARGDKDSIAHIMNYILKFSSLSGLHPSLHKSTSFIACCDPFLVSWFQLIYNVPLGSLPDKFLEVPLILKELSNNYYMPLLQKITSRIDTWTNFLLSMAGRAQLLKSFLWKGNSMAIGGAKIAWNLVCLPCLEGGLGLKCLVQWNYSQHLVHLWQLVANKGSLWVHWDRTTVLKKNDFWTMKVPSDCSWFWRRLLNLRDVEKMHLRYKIGNGSYFNFLLDPWFKGSPIALGLTDPVIACLRSSHAAAVSHFIDSGSWVFPDVNMSQHHASRAFLVWKVHFLDPGFDLQSLDRVF